LSEPEPPARVCVKKIIEVTRTSGDSTVIEYFDLNGQLLFTIPESTNE